MINDCIHTCNEWTFEENNQGYSQDSFSEIYYGICKDCKAELKRTLTTTEKIELL